MKTAVMALLGALLPMVGSTRTVLAEPPTWESVNPGMVGPARPLLLDKEVACRTPEREVSLPANTGRVLSVECTSDAATAYVLSAQRGQYVITKVDFAGATAEVFARIPETRPARVELTLTRDDASLLFPQPDGSAILVFDARTGEKRAELKSSQPADRIFGCFAHSGADLVCASVSATEIQTWKLSTGEAASRWAAADASKGEYAAPIGIRADGAVLVVSAAGQDDRPAYHLRARASADGKELASTMMKPGEIPVAGTDGETIVALQNDDKGWVNARTVSTSDFAERSSHPITPPVFSIDRGVSDAGEHLVLLEYMVQPALVYDLATGKFTAVVGPEVGGCEAVAWTPKADRVVAAVGAWENGTLQTNRVAVYPTTRE